MNSNEKKGMTNEVLLSWLNECERATAKYNFTGTSNLIVFIFSKTQASKFGVPLKYGLSRYYLQILPNNIIMVMIITIQISFLCNFLQADQLTEEQIAGKYWNITSEIRCINVPLPLPSSPLPSPPPHQKEITEDFKHSSFSMSFVTYIYAMLSFLHH